MIDGKLRDAWRADHETVEAAKARWEAMVARAEQAEAALRDATEALDRDKTGLAKALDDVIHRSVSSMWIDEGRGPYRFDENEYREETGRALRAIIEIAKRGLNDSGKIANEHVPRARAVLASVPVEIRLVELQRRREEDVAKEREACRTVERQLDKTVDALDTVTRSFEAGAAAWRANAVKLTKERDDARETLEITKGPLINAADVLDILSTSEVLGDFARTECAKWEKECRDAHAAVMALKSDADLTPEEHAEGARVREMLLKTAQDETAKREHGAMGPKESYVLVDAERAPPVPTLAEVKRLAAERLAPQQRSAPTCFTCMRPMVSAGMRTRGPDSERPPWELFKCDRHEATTVLLDTDPLDTRPARKVAYLKGWDECVGFVRMSRDTFREGTASRTACETVLADLEKAATLPIGEERDDR